MNNSVWTTDSQSLSDFEFLHFRRYFPILFDSCGHWLFKSIEYPIHMCIFTNIIIVFIVC